MTQPHAFADDSSCIGQCHAKAMLLTALLPELLQLIFEDIHCRDLLNVVLTCRAFSYLVSRRAQKHGKVHRVFNRLHIAEPGHTGLVYEKGKAWTWFMLEVLKSREVAACVEHLHIKDELCGESLSKTDNSGTPRCQWTGNAADRALVIEAVQACEWILPAEKSHKCALIIDRAVDDVMLMLTMTRLTNLKSLFLPVASWDNFAIHEPMVLMRRVACKAADIEERGLPPDTTLPFNKLVRVILSGCNIWATTPATFNDLIPLLALPSLRFLKSSDHYDGRLEWPTDLPKSRLRELRLIPGYISAKMIFQWGAAFRGPCVIDRRPHSRRGRLNFLGWDYFEIPYENASVEHWKIVKDGQSLNTVGLVPDKASTDAHGC